LGPDQLEIQGLVHTKKIENSILILKTHIYSFFLSTLSEKFVNKTITGYFEFMFEENSGREIT